MKEKFRLFSEKLDSYIETKRFRWLRGLVLLLGFTVTGCVCFLAGFFMNRDDNMIYKSNINSINSLNEASVSVTAVPGSQEAPVTEPPQETEVTQEITTEAPKITIDADLLQSYVSDDISVDDSEYRYTNTVSFQNRNTVKEIGIPLTKKSFRLTYEGVITAGIDCSLLTAYADNDTYTIYVTLPEACITSHDISEDSFTVKDKKDSIFNPLSYDDYLTAAENRMSEMESKALDEGLLESVYSDAEQVICDYLNLDGIISSMYTIEFIRPDTASAL